MQLSESDRKQIRRECRAGFVVPLLLFLTSMIPYIAFIVNTGDPMEYVLRTSLIWIIVSLVAAVLIMFLMNRKYFADLREGEKYSELKTIQETTKRTDYEAGSGVVGASAMEMKAFTRYDLIVENTAYQVDDEMFFRCKKGDKIVFYYASQSKYLIGFELKK